MLSDYAVFSLETPNTSSKNNSLKLAKKKPMLSLPPSMPDNNGARSVLQFLKFEAKLLAVHAGLLELLKP
jgi:hypothetical protein